ncbi:Ldh family oxidoreductase [Frankia sp. CNm7]|uniref:Ldh family oxidoreductase n=1 Tax=Frankia nepalensis TaxID=1836974 RepID=A0A937RSA1_9ACTN|nr:Ldh family oxidoreductase [Frankia nepalensis]MBL7497562.1 Ldh family oxidoreductase [Frankia nepalensis]MBL7509625.1 Ldh family oxidoreductase [Frankia nepalensis]MBL7517111.1 Ldh family oxidoreductase [Frankia nepalensis]MBL7631016.1 Ldh family oxidoreductase [Frankia nepalensis]
MAAPRVVVQDKTLRTLVSDIFVAAGTNREHADTVADVLVWANLRGVDSHGVSRVPRYLELFEKGEANPRPAIAVDELRSAVAVVDADAAPGPVALALAMDQAVSMARSAGVAWVSVRGTVHTGAIGYYTECAARYGMAGLGIVAGVPNMAYPGGTGAGVATSPLSVAIPAGRHPTVLLDMATAVIALGRIAQHKAAGMPLPEGAALTKDGRPTTDPAQAVIPLPVGGAKGAGMSLVFEMLASGLTANPIVSAFHGGTPQGRRHRQNAVVLAVDVAAFLPVEQFRGIVDATVDAVKALPADDPDRELLVPGERGARTYAERLTNGVPLPKPLVAKLVAHAAALGAPIPEGL